MSKTRTTPWVLACAKAASAAARVVGVTAGASAPELLVRQVVAQLQAWGGEVAEELAGRPEQVVFSLPRALRKTAPSA